MQICKLNILEKISVVLTAKCVSTGVFIFFLFKKKNPQINQDNI